MDEERKLSETEKMIVELLREKADGDTELPSVEEFCEFLGFVSSERCRDLLEGFLLHCQQAWELDKGVGAPGGTEDAKTLRKQMSLLVRANRAVEKQNEALHRRVEHLREQLKNKADEVDRLRTALTSREKPRSY